MKNVALLILLSCFYLNAVCQSIAIQGLVTDKETGKPISGASVFLSNTSIGTATNDKGSFTLHVPSGKFDLIVSSLGYETHAETINADKVAAPLNIALQTKANELTGVVVMTYDAAGWPRWGKTFVADFIGTSYNASACDIKNYDIIKFRYSKTKNYLEAFADEPLIIINKALGYTIHYKLENFAHDFNANTISYEGFPLFEQMPGNLHKQKKWNETRKDVYYGSVMHFMRCLYVNKLTENGFEMRRLEKIPNLERRRVQALYKYMAGADGNINFEDRLPKDSLEYYTKILHQTDETSILHNEVLRGDSVAYGEDSVTAALLFKDYLQITYTSKKEPYEYRRIPGALHSPSGSITSLAVLLYGRPVFASYNGAYYQPQDMQTSGYWAWSEKVCNILPFDWWP